MSHGSRSISETRLPHNKKTATYTLDLFNENAFNLSYREAFSRSVEILYGTYFTILQDFSNRLYFSCTVCLKDMNSSRSLHDHALSGSHLKVCLKDMNSSRSLHDHALSGSHLKGVEFKSSESTSRGRRSRYDKDSLEYQLESSKVIIVGLERVEGFIGRNKRRYYKCTLCSAHGNVDAMFGHLIGDKHTDKFIKSRLILKNSTITAEERNSLRKMLMDREGYGVHNIKIISGNDFYPSVWEAERKYGKNKYKKTEKYETFEESNSFKSEQNSGKKITPENMSVIKIRSAEEDFKYLIDKFKYIVATHSIEETRFERPVDLRMALIIMGCALFWLHFTNLSYLTSDQMHHDHYLQQKEILEKCMGHVINFLGDNFNLKYPDLAVDLRKKNQASAVTAQRAKPTATSSHRRRSEEVITLSDVD